LTDCPARHLRVCSAALARQEKATGILMRVIGIAAAAAVVLAGTWLSHAFAGETPGGTVQTGWHLEEREITGMQARHNLRGQAWATELFGRRYGRNLLA
jgi:hypothetical protein